MNAYAQPEWLEQHLDDPGVHVVEASVARQSYDEAHIPGAVWVDFHGDLLRNGDDTSGEVLTPAQFAALMGRLGITPETTVVWYGDRHSSYAIRGFWMMDYYRHPGGNHVLAGGRERWLAEGRPVSRTSALPPPSVYPVPVATDAANRATWEDVHDAIGKPGTVVLDVRAPEEYAGTLARARRSGHVPGAVHVEWTRAAVGPNELLPEAELRALYESRGVTPDKEVIAHCQLGIRAAHTWFVLKHVLGYPNVKNYDASWQEWGNRDDSPIEK